MKIAKVKPVYFSVDDRAEATHWLCQECGGINLISQTSCPQKPHENLPKIDEAGYCTNEEPDFSPGSDVLLKKNYAYLLV